MEENEIIPVETTHMQTLERLNQEADTIQRYMNVPANIQDPASLVYRLRDLDAYTSRLSEMYIQSKTLKERVLNKFLNDNEARLNKMTATVSNRLISKNLCEYNTTCSRLDTMYKTIEHLSRNLVTQISYIKQQMISGC